jgi:bifunctional NMN adenylyltransferase/nudix hydrolase
MPSAMSKTNQNRKLGVVIARFQTPSLHAGHKHLLHQVLQESDEVLILIGTKFINRTEKNPLTYKERASMVRLTMDEICKSSEDFTDKKFSIDSIVDRSDNNTWSGELDLTIRKLIWTCQEPYDVTLYGGRDSFIKDYTGDFQTKEVESVPVASATHIRKGLSLVEPSYNLDMYKGIIYGACTQWPHVYSVVDVAVLKGTYSVDGTLTPLAHRSILLGRKPGESGWRFPGGFVDITDTSFETAARREVLEECGDLELSPMKYITNVVCDDYRYRGEKDKMFTTLYRTEFIYGRPVAGDDLEEVSWFPFVLEEVINVLIDGHKDLFTRLYESEQLPLSVRNK